MNSKLTDAVIDVTKQHYPQYRQKLLNSLPKLTDSETTIRRLTAKNIYSLIADDQYITPAKLIKNVLWQRVQPSKETHMGAFFEAVLVDINRAYHSGKQVIVPARVGNSVDLEVSSSAKMHGFKLEIKSGITWANSQAREKFLQKMADKAEPGFDLIEGIVCARDANKTWYHDGQPIQRLCGVDLFDRICNDKTIGVVILETIQELESIEIYSSPMGCLDNQIDRHLTQVADAIIDEYSTGYRGVLLWEGNSVCWYNLLRLNSGDWDTDVFTFKSAA